MNSWTDERVWDAVDSWRWIPPSSKKIVTDEYELIVTPGSYALTYVYGFKADELRADQVLDELRGQIENIGGTGARFQLTPRSRPIDIRERLARHGYKAVEEAEVLVWELYGTKEHPRLPEFPSPAGTVVREVSTDAEFNDFNEVSRIVFGDPIPPPDTQKAFEEEFHKKLKEDGYSDRFLAYDGDIPIGLAGMTIVGRVARFWGSGVLEQHRHRGAYGALVVFRCKEAAGRGAEIALVIARVGTSGPILRHHGFRPVGTVSIFEIRF